MTKGPGGTSTSSTPSRNSTSSAPALSMSPVSRPPSPGTKPISSAPGSAASVCRILKPFQPSLMTPSDPAAKAAGSLGVIKDGWNGFNILHTEAALPGALDIGFVPGEGGLDTGDMLKAGALEVLFLLGVDEVEVPPGPFVIYIGTHGDRGAHRADVILPGAA